MSVNVRRAFVDSEAKLNAFLPSRYHAQASLGKVFLLTLDYANHSGEQVRFRRHRLKDPLGLAVHLDPASPENAF